MTTQNVFFRPLHSTELIQRLTKALSPDDWELTGRTARDFKRGMMVRFDTRERFVDAHANALTDSGFLPIDGLVPGPPDESRKFIADVIDWHIACWDHLASNLGAISMPTQTQRLMALSYLRLFAVDLAVRMAAVCEFAHIDVANDEPPLWAQEGGRGQLLLKLTRSVGRSRLTLKGQNGFHDHIPVSRQTVESWVYKGVRPSEVNLRRIGEVLATFLAGKSADEISTILRRHYVLCELAEEIAGVVGWAEVGDLASALMRLSSRLLEYWRTIEKPHDSLPYVADYGVRTSELDREIDWLREKEGDLGWKADLHTAYHKAWAGRLYHLSGELGMAEEAARFVESTGHEIQHKEALLDILLERSRISSGSGGRFDMPWEESDGPKAEAQRCYSVALDRAEAGAYETANDLIDHAIKLQPDVAWYPMTRAELLAEQGKFSEAIEACKAADRLAPDWEKPRVYIGTMLNHQFRFAESEAHLLATAKRFGHTLNLALQLGMALMENGKYREAVDELAIVLGEREVPMAVNMTSICQFKLGNRDEGWRLAKRANQLGRSVAYEMASNGEFGKT